MRTLILALLITILPVAIACGEDVEKDVWDDWFGYAELQAGGLWSFERDEFMPYFALPTIGYRKAAIVLGGEFDLEAIGDGPTAGIVGVTFYLGNLKDWGIDVPATEHFGVNFGPVLRYDFDTGGTEVGLVLSIVDLSFSDGNADRQKKR